MNCIKFAGIVGMRYMCLVLKALAKFMLHPAGALLLRLYALRGLNMNIKYTAVSVRPLEACVQVVAIIIHP